MYGNASTYIITFILRSIHDIHNRCVNYNIYFVIFVLTGVNPFVMPDVKYICEGIKYNKVNLFLNINKSIFTSKYKYNIWYLTSNSEVTKYFESITFW